MGAQVKSTVKSLASTKINAQNLASIKDNEHVVELSLSNYKDIIFDKDHDVFVKFYREGCGHCEALRPGWSKLGEALKDVDGLIIAEMERGICPEDLGLTVCPEVNFYPIENKDEFILYEGDHDFESWKNFLEKHSTKYQEYLANQDE